MIDILKKIEVYKCEEIVVVKVVVLFGEFKVCVVD